MATVLAFGAFDPLHAGHTHFLGAARALGDRLVVALATDDAIVTLKHHAPRASFLERTQLLRMLPIVDDVVASDASGSFAVIDTVQPDILVLGYDQDALHSALTDWMTTHRQIPIVTIDAHEPEKYKSSLMKN